MFGNSKIFRLALLALSVLLAGNLSAQTVKGTVKDSIKVFVCHFISTIYVLNGRKMMTWTL